jgi:hypothetical protein
MFNLQMVILKGTVWYIVTYTYQQVCVAKYYFDW